MHLLVSDHMAGVYTRYLAIFDYPYTRYHHIWNTFGSSLRMFGCGLIGNGCRIEDNEVRNIAHCDSTPVFEVKLLSRHPGHFVNGGLQW
jgi:hypothetical protein